MPKHRSDRWTWQYWVFYAPLFILLNAVVSVLLHWPNHRILELLIACGIGLGLDLIWRLWKGHWPHQATVKRV